MKNQVLTEHTSLNDCNTFLSSNWENKARIAAVYVTSLGQVTYVTKHYV